MATCAASRHSILANAGAELAGWAGTATGSILCTKRRIVRALWTLVRTCACCAFWAVTTSGAFSRTTLSHSFKLAIAIESWRTRFARTLSFIRLVRANRAPLRNAGSFWALVEHWAHTICWRCRSSPTVAEVSCGAESSWLNQASSTAVRSSSARGATRNTSRVGEVALFTQSRHATLRRAVRTSWAFPTCWTIIGCC